MKQLIINYVFSASAQTVTFTDYNPVDLNRILLITNTTSNTIIYNFVDPTKGGTVATNVLTLTFDTTAMSNSDALQIYYDVDTSLDTQQISGNVDIVSVSTLATAAKQDTGNTSLTSIDTKVGEVQTSPTANTLLDRLKQIYTAITGVLNIRSLSSSTDSIAVTGSVTANAGTNLNTSLLALEAGNLATIAGKDFATQTTLALIKAKTDNLDTALSGIKTGTDKIVTSAALDATVVATNTNAGATTDAAVTTDANGTLSSKIRGLVKILNDVWNSTTHNLGVTISNATLAVTQSGAWSFAAQGYSAKPSTQLTRPNNNTTYTANTAIANATSSATYLTFSGAARVANGTGIVLNAGLLDAANQTLAGNFEIWLFSTAPTALNDNANFAPSAADLANLVGVFPFATSYVGNNASGASGNRVFTSDTFNKAFVCTGSTTSLYGLVVTRNAYVPVAQEVFTFFLNIIQD